MIIFLWLFLVLAVALFYLWSFQIFSDQKRAWKAFATKYKFSLQSSGFLKPSYILEENQGLTLNIFVQDAIEDRGLKTSYSVIELIGTGNFDGRVAFGTEDTKAFIDELDINNAPLLQKSLKDCGADIVAAEGDKDTDYFTKDRRAAIKSLFSFKLQNKAGEDVPYALVVIIDDEATTIHLETTDPLAHPKMLDDIYKVYKEAALKLCAPAPQKETVEKED